MLNWRFWILLIKWISSFNLSYSAIYSCWIDRDESEICEVYRFGFNYLDESIFLLTLFNSLCTLNFFIIVWLYSSIRVILSSRNSRISYAIFCSRVASALGTSGSSFMKVLLNVVSLLTWEMFGVSRKGYWSNDLLGLSKSFRSFKSNIFSSTLDWGLDDRKVGGKLYW